MMVALTNLHDVSVHEDVYFGTVNVGLSYFSLQGVCPIHSAISAQIRHTWLQGHQIKKKINISISKFQW